MHRTTLAQSHLSRQRQYIPDRIFISTHSGLPMLYPVHKGITSLSLSDAHHIRPLDKMASAASSVCHCCQHRGSSETLPASLLPPAGSDQIDRAQRPFSIAPCAAIAGHSARHVETFMAHKSRASCITFASTKPLVLPAQTAVTNV